MLSVPRPLIFMLEKISLIRKVRAIKIEIAMRTIAVRLAITIRRIILILAITSRKDFMCQCDILKEQYQQQR